MKRTNGLGIFSKLEQSLHFPHQYIWKTPAGKTLYGPLLLVESEMVQLVNLKLFTSCEESCVDKSELFFTDIKPKIINQSPAMHTAILSAGSKLIPLDESAVEYSELSGPKQ
jgi:hypothetical protein